MLKLSPKGRGYMDPKDQNWKEPLASELYSDLKKATAFRERIIYILLGVIAALIVALAITNVYHIYMWSQFETVVVDSGDGYGNANYVEGDNTGGIFNGEGGSTSSEIGDIPGDQNQG